MTSKMIQDKRDGLELLGALTDERARKAIFSTFEHMLGEYLLALLDPSLDDGSALTIRAKAIGLVETLDSMGVKISQASDVPIRRAAQARVAQGFGHGLAE